MRYSSKSGVLAVAVLLSGAAVFGSACGGSGGSDRTGATAGSGNSSSAGAPAGGGAGGAGGAVAAGGASGSGTGGAATCDSAAACCPTATCVCPYPAGDGMAATMKIANMEDGTSIFKTATVMNASGYWDFSRDASTGTVMPTGTTKPTPVDGGANGTMKAMHVSGMNLTGWGAALAAELSNGCPFDGSKYGGISFYAKGSSTVLEGANKLLFLVGNPEYIPKANGGFCDDKATMPLDQNCYARHRITIDLTPEWKKYVVAWEDLKAPTYLTTGKPFGANRIRDIVFNASGPSPDPMPAATFDFWVDELEFVPVGTKGNVSTGAGGAGAGGASSGGAGGAGGASAGAGGASAGAGGAAAGTGGSGG